MTAGRCNSLYWWKSTGSPGCGEGRKGGEELGRAWRPAANPEAKQAPQPDFTLGHKPPPPTETGGTGSGHLGSGAPEHTPQLLLASE